MLTQAILKISYLVVPDVKPGSAVAERLIREYKARNRPPQYEMSMTELRLVGGHSIIAFCLQPLLLLPAAAVHGAAKDVLLGADVFLAPLLFSGVVLHLVRYYRALLAYYAEKRTGNHDRHGRGVGPDVRMLSSDRDLAFQAIFAAIVLLVWILNG